MIISHLKLKDVERMAKLAILASKPEQGVLFTSVVLTAEQIDLTPYIARSSRGTIIDIDHYDGRIVNFQARDLGKNEWEFHPDITTHDLQTWKDSYASYQHLAEDVE